jgi:O-antigen/teichoic acid export membrane protein
MSERAGGTGRVRVFLTGAALLSLTMLLVSAANYVLNFALARLLAPAQFGDATLAITLVLAAAVVAASLQLVASRSVAAHPASADSLRRMLVRAAIIAGCAMALLLGGGAWVLADLLRTSTPWMFVIIGAGLPVYFVQAVHRGVLQGSLRFRRLALSYAAEAVVRVAVVLGLVAAGFGVIGASFGILASFVASAAVARTRSQRSAGGSAIGWGALRVTVTAAVIMLLAQTLLNNADLVLAKATFDPETAGVYAAAAVLCRSLYFVSWSVVQVVVPVLASASSTAAERRRSLAIAFGVIAGLGALATVLMATAGGMLVQLLFGAEYASAAPLLVPYTLATSLLSTATLLAAVDVARGRSAGPVVLLIGALIQVGVLAIAGQTPASMTWLQVCTTGATLCALALAALLRRSRDGAATPLPISSDSIPTAVIATAEQRSS